MTIDPRIGFWLGIVAGVLVFSATGPGAAELLSILGPSAGGIVVGICGYLAGILALVAGALHSIPSGNTAADSAKFYLGPTSPPAPPTAPVK